jgi:hypothetical protein
VKLVEKLGIPELTTKQIETLCPTAENAAREHVLAKVSSKMVKRSNTSVEADGAKPVNLTVEIDMTLSPQMKYSALAELVGGAVKEALKASENYLRKLI